MMHGGTALNRFLRYASMDTQSDPSSKTCPSTEKQRSLGRLLVEELLELGCEDAEMDEHGYVYATLPGVSGEPSICFCSHMDTSPETSGKDVSPIVHENWQGDVIHLPHGGVEIDPRDHPDLLTKLGEDIVTADGRTLLGADNKAGIAAIMDCLSWFQNHPETPHATLKLLFTPDEEIGRGADLVDLDRLGADFGYTVDGESVGSMEDETFSADGAVVVFEGTNAHPGFAQGTMVNALKVACDFIDALPKDTWSPETTSGRVGFVHPYEMSGTVEKTTITFIVRSFVTEELAVFAQRLESIQREVLSRWPGATGHVQIQEQYRNMKEVLDQHPHVANRAAQAIEAAGLTLKRGSIRGGTDGSRLSFMGLPCPNIFAGEHAFHSKQEWVSVQDMEKATEVLIRIAQL